MRRIMILVGLLVVFVAACTSPRDEAESWSKRFPAEIGSWQRDENILRLTAADASNYGQVMMRYENPDEQVISLGIHSYPTRNIAELELASLLQEWQLLGATLDRERVKGEAFDSLTTRGGQRYIYQAEETLLTLTVFQTPPIDSEEGETISESISQDEIDLWLETLVEVVRNKD